MLLNPGSPTDRRRQPEHTFALLCEAAHGKCRVADVPVRGDPHTRGSYTDTPRSVRVRRPV